MAFSGRLISLVASATPSANGSGSSGLSRNTLKSPIAMIRTKTIVKKLIGYLSKNTIQQA